MFLLKSAKKKYRLLLFIWHMKLQMTSAFSVFKSLKAFSFDLFITCLFLFPTFLAVSSVYKNEPNTQKTIKVNIV